MKLYFAPGACSLSPHIVAARSGHRADFEQVDNREKKTKSGQDFWSINPKGQVPVLEIRQRAALTEGRLSCNISPTRSRRRVLCPRPERSTATACRSG